MFGRIILVVMFIETLTAQVIYQPSCQQQILQDNIIQALPANIGPNVVSEYSSVDLCKTLANAVQSMVLNKLSTSAYKKPVFNQIAGPLLSDIATKMGCQCPVCGTSVPNVTPNYGIANVQVPTINQIQTSNNCGCPTRLQASNGYVVGSNVLANQNVLGNQNILANQNALANALATQQLLASQNVVGNAGQLRYNDALALLDSLRGQTNCGCGQRNVLF